MGIRFVIDLVMILAWTVACFGATNLTADIMRQFSDLASIPDPVACTNAVEAFRGDLDLTSTEFSDLLTDLLLNPGTANLRMRRRAGIWLRNYATSNAMIRIRESMGVVTGDLQVCAAEAYVWMDQAEAGSCAFVSNILVVAPNFPAPDKWRLYRALDNVPGSDGLVKERRVNNFFLDMATRDTNMSVFLDQTLCGRMANYGVSAERLSIARFVLETSADPDTRTYFQPIYNGLSVATNLPCCRNDAATIPSVPPPRYPLQY